MRTHLKLLVLCLMGELLFWSPAISAESTREAGGQSRVEIKKFRFRRHNTKNFERLVIEFDDKDRNATPEISTVPSLSGKEANIQIENISLVGAIPEALINDSYVARSKFLGPVSINTDGPVKGFVIRTFLKQSVGVDAFWLSRPARLVLDVFPANSSRVQGRVPESDFERDIARIRPPEMTEPKDPGNGIVCYPINSAVSAAVSFHSKAMSSPGPLFDNLPLSNLSGQSHQEPVICFLASSQVVASVAFKAKIFDPNTYVQWEPNFLQQAPPVQQAPAQSQNNSPALIPPVSAIPTVPPPPAKPPVITSIAPGRTPLGASLVNPTEVQRLPSSSSGAPRLPSFGDTPPPAAAAAPAPATASMLPPLK